MSFEFFNPLAKRNNPHTRPPAHKKKDANLIIMGWKPGDDTYLTDQDKSKKETASVGNKSSDVVTPKSVVHESEYSVFTKPSQAMQKRDFRILRELNNIHLSYANMHNHDFKVIRYWYESGLLPQIQTNLLKQSNLRHPTPVQMQVIPVALQFKDLVCTAPTGSGKTLAFVLPLINFLFFMPRIRKEKSHLGPYAIVLATARELILQIADVFDSVSSGLNLKSKRFLGGHDKLDNLFEPAEVVFATVGRFRDLLETKNVCLEQCYYVVIDEADSMIDSNLTDTLDYILSQIPETNNKSVDDGELIEQEQHMREFTGLCRVTQLYSATMPDKLGVLVDKYLTNPVTIKVVPNEDQLGLKQHYFEYLSETDAGSFANKLRLLKLWLTKLDLKVIVFFNSKHELDRCFGALKGSRQRIACYHGGFDQNERERVIQRFREGQVDVLLSTDLGGRGLDIQDVRSVVNFEAPKDFEHYVHRTGRTARAGKTGTCLTFFSRSDSLLFGDVVGLLQASQQIIPEFLKPYVTKNPMKGMNIILVD